MTSYNDFRNKDLWATASGLTNSYIAGQNPGDIPAPFVLEYSNPISSETTFVVGELSITVSATRSNPISKLEWDSKTGIVSAEASVNDSTRIPISYTGNSLGGIPVGGISTFGVRKADGTYDTNSITLNYHYWYY